MLKIKIIIIFSPCLFFSYVSANDCLIKNSSVEGVGIGDPIEKIFSTFSSKYQIVEEKKQGYMLTLILYQNKGKILMFSIGPNNRILFIDVYNNYVTTENIGVGTTMSDAIKTYGKVSLVPTDEGYLIYFERTKELSFLLDDTAIPKRLRNIPDDVITEKQEKEILSLKNVKIKAIKIYGIYDK